jgi:hypothetical protein
MNMLARNQEFTVVAAPTTEWLVLRCSPGRTMALAAALRDRGAWTPTWTRRRIIKGKHLNVTEACIPGFVFAPVAHYFDLRDMPLARFTFMRDHEGKPTRVRDGQLNPLRKIADKPLIPASQLPRPGAMVRFTSGPFEGMRGKVINCTIRAARVAIHGIHNPVQMPPSILQETGLESEPAKRATRLRNRA